MTSRPRRRTIGRWCLLTACLLAPPLAGCSSAQQPAPPATTTGSATTVTPTSTAPALTAPGPDDQVIARRLADAVAADVAAHPEIVGEMVLIRRAGRSWTAAAGSAEAPGTGRPLEASMAFRIASVTKTFVAAATYRLIEQGRFTEATTVDRLASPELVALLRTGGYRPEEITVGQLLDHTSGVLDYVFGPGRDDVSRVLADPRHRWTRTEQVAFAVEGEPVGPPGGQYHYSDTGYVLLGDVIERTTSLGLGAALRSLLRFDQLGLRHTYLESIDPVPASAPPRIHQYLGPTDTYDFDPSMDLWGGGGLVSTLADLATFFEALLAGEVFDDPATLAAMLEVPATNVEAGAASGLFRVQVGGRTCWGHEGFWGVSVQRCPDADLTVVRSVSQAVSPEGLSAGLTSLITELLAVG